MKASKQVHSVTRLIVCGMALAAMAACRPGQKDPPLNYDVVRIDANLQNLKLDPENPLSQIGAPDLWKKASGKNVDGTRVRVAVVGTGIDYTIPDLREALVVNTGEISDTSRQNSFDDDNNGYPDDVIGFDFFSGDPYPYDWNGHDTFTASLIAATGHSNSKVLGVAPNAELLIARYIGPDGRGKGLDAAEALEYSIVNNAKVIYFNWPEGGFDADSSSLIVDEFASAGAKNIVVVIPAGNSGNQNVPEFLKAAAKLPNVIVVAGLDRDGKISRSSNYGSFLATTAAPTQGAVAFLPGPSVSSDLTTTSVAAAYVTGAAALISTMPGMASAKNIRSAVLAAVSDRRAPGGLDVLSRGPISLAKLAN